MLPSITSAADGQGIIDKAGYLHWELWNWGNNVPQVVGNPAQSDDRRNH
jgi:hypothetical protein